MYCGEEMTLRDAFTPRHILLMSTEHPVGMEIN